ncbi:MAG: class I SAM-dependent methyltransferase [Deltaproteobacteria bacterium]|nr:class I SAM-dependent methyltransferase [Deltaproteobacteria bacterium]
MDIGCGTGNYLRILRELGWDVYGIEPSERAAEIGRKQFGLNIKTGTLMDHKFPVQNNLTFIKKK